MDNKALGSELPEDLKDLLVSGVTIKRDGKRIDPLDFFVEPPPEEEGEPEQ